MSNELTKSALTALTFSYLTGTSFKGLHIGTSSLVWDHTVYDREHNTLYKKGVLKNDEDGKVEAKVKATALYKRTEAAKKALEDAGYSNVTVGPDYRRKNVEVRGFKDGFTTSVRLGRDGYAWAEAEGDLSRGTSHRGTDEVLDAAMVAEAEDNARYHRVTGAAWKLYRALEEASKTGEMTREEMRGRVRHELDDTLDAVAGYHGTDEELLAKMRSSNGLKAESAVVERVLEIRDERVAA